MDATVAGQLISAGENLVIEFKRRQSKQALSDRKLVEAVACMANGRGGHIFIGVEDNGKVSGAAHWHNGHTDPRKIESLIQNRTRPSFVTKVDIISIAGTELIAVEVPQSDTPIATQDGVYTRRVLKATGDPECLAMEPSYLFSRYNTANARDWATLPALGASLTNLDPAEFDRFRRLAGSSTGDRNLSDLEDEEILRSLGLYDDSPQPIKLGAILLFGTPEALSRWTPNHEVILQVMEGSSVRLNHRTSSPLLNAMEEISDRLAVYRHEEEINVGVLRMALSNLPERASREAIANALVHRDYTELGPIHILLDDDVFRVSSPGGLPRSVTLDNIFDASTPRSPALADTFKRAGLVERSGRGVKIMFETLLTNGHNEPEFAGTTDESVVVAMPIAVGDQEFGMFTRKWIQNHPELSVRKLRLIHSIRSEGPASRTTLTTRLKDAEPRISREIKELQDLGLVATSGRSSTREYRLGAVFHDLVGRRSDFIRATQVDEARAEQLILAYVDQFGSINRSQAVETCGLEGQNAYRLLKHLVDSGALVKIGRTRNTRYERP